MEDYWCVSSLVAHSWRLMISLVPYTFQSVQEVDTFIMGSRNLSRLEFKSYVHPLES